MKQDHKLPLPWRFRAILSSLHRNALKASLWTYITATAILFTACAMVMYAYEGDKFPDFFTFFYWFIVTISTVGYGDISPSTPPGRIMSILVIFLGIGLFSIIAGAAITAVNSIKNKVRFGILSVMKSDHICILGYQPLITDRFIDEIVADLNGHRGDIVLVTDQIQEYERGKVIFSKGDITQEADQLDNSIDKARKIIIRGRDDNETLMATIIAASINQKADIVVYAADPKRVAHFSKIAPNVSAIISNSVELMVQEMQDPGISSIISDLISNRKGQTLYRVPITIEGGPSTFGEAKILLQQNVRGMSIALQKLGQAPAPNPPEATPIKVGDAIFLIAQERPAGII